MTSLLSVWIALSEIVPQHGASAAALIAPSHAGKSAGRVPGAVLAASRGGFSQYDCDNQGGGYRADWHDGTWTGYPEDGAYGRGGYEDQGWADGVRGGGGYGGRVDFGQEGVYRGRYPEGFDWGLGGDYGDGRGRKYGAQGVYGQAKYGAQSDYDRREQQWQQQRPGQREQFGEQFGRGVFGDGRTESYCDPYAPDSGSGYAGRKNYHDGSTQSFQGAVSFDGGWPQDYRNGGEYLKGDRRKQEYESIGRLPSQFGSLQRRDQAERRPSELVRGDAFGFGPGFGVIDRMMDPFAGLGMMDRMMDEMMGFPFAGFEMFGQMMDRFGSELRAGANWDQCSIERLLDDVRVCLSADPAVGNMLGENIRLGTPFARSSSSVVANGAARSRLQLGVPVMGSQGEGRARLIADEGGIARLELDTGSRVVDVPVGMQEGSGPGRFGGDVIDAEVVEDEAY